MMASSWKRQCFINRRLSLWLLTRVLAVIGLFSVTESAAQIQLQGEVGQNMTFHCPFTKHKMITFFYLQKGENFVNGYYASRNITKLIWKNTKLENKTTVHMYGLNISHIGHYKCVIQYSDSQNVDEYDIHLSVTANYNKPTVTISCDENRRFSCLVKCASQGGYPRTKMIWNVGVTSSQMWKVLNSSDETDPDTMLVNSSSTANFNCSYGMQKFLSCSVGHITSDMFSVCKPQDPPNNDPTVIVIATCAVVVVSIMVLLVVLWRYRKRRQAGVAAGAVRPEEVIVLNGYRGGEEAS